MRPLTFNGFLKSTLKQLSGTKTESLTKLLRLSKENPRLYAPLVLYIVLMPNATQRESLMAKEPTLREEIEKHFASAHTEEALIDILSSNKAPREYGKVYRSYLSVRDKTRTEQNLKDLIRKKVLRLKAEANVSDYKIYKSLGLNSGNYHAFMQQGNTAKLSLANARRVLEYVEGVSA